MIVKIEKTQLIVHNFVCQLQAFKYLEYFILFFGSQRE